MGGEKEGRHVNIEVQRSREDTRRAPVDRGTQEGHGGRREHQQGWGRRRTQPEAPTPHQRVPDPPSLQQQRRAERKEQRRETLIWNGGQKRRTQQGPAEKTFAAKDRMDRRRHMSSHRREDECRDEHQSGLGEDLNIDRTKSVNQLCSWGGRFQKERVLLQKRGLVLLTGGAQPQKGATSKRERERESVCARFPSQGKMLIMVEGGPVQTTEIVNQAVLNEPGISITLNCTFKAPSNKNDDIACIWYKQTLKKEPQQVGTAKINKMAMISSQFNNFRFIIKWINTTNSLTILNLTEEDEGTYFCGVAEKSEVHFSSVTFVAVADCSAVKPVGPVVICLGAVLGVCAAVIIAQAIIICKMKNSESGNDSGDSNSDLDAVIERERYGKPVKR
ncbi:hypothetical protein P4O66_003761 [Electrophorus voltai]|uniref:Ig-like domain-containing protein n=1 Tax=Electrophorus voltai TaxID=2609070 RepID=A0AAD9E4F3_9TELE|nr:hypothetical protein P4O66_003761 [Electrophorus voltai]